MKRKKRLEKGIKSIEQQIKLHEEKLEEAKKIAGMEWLVTYYEKDLERLKKQGKRKKEFLEK